MTIYESELAELIQISGRLNSLNQTLSVEVSNLKSSYIELSNRLELSAGQSIALTESLHQTAGNLIDLRKSFDEYTNAVRAQTEAMEFQRNLGIGAGILGVITGAILAIIF